MHHPICAVISLMSLCHSVSSDVFKISCMTTVHEFLVTFVL